MARNVLELFREPTWCDLVDVVRVIFSDTQIRGGQTFLKVSR